MAITKSSGRQELIEAKADFAFGDLTSGTAVAAIDLPRYARILKVYLRIETAFNSATTDALIVQSNESTPKAYITIGAAQNSLPISKVWSTDPTLSGTASSNVGFVNPNPSTLDIKWTGVGAITTGAATLLVEYVVANRAEFTQG